MSAHLQNPASPMSLATRFVRGFAFGMGAACAWAATMTLLGFVFAFIDQN